MVPEVQSLDPDIYRVTSVIRLSLRFLPALRTGGAMCGHRWLVVAPCQSLPLLSLVFKRQQNLREVEPCWRKWVPISGSRRTHRLSHSGPCSLLPDCWGDLTSHLTFLSLQPRVTTNTPSLPWVTVSSKPWARRNPSSLKRCLSGILPQRHKRSNHLCAMQSFFRLTLTGKLHRSKHPMLFRLGISVPSRGVQGHYFLLHFHSSKALSSSLLGSTREQHSKHVSGCFSPSSPWVEVMPHTRLHGPC